MPKQVMPAVKLVPCEQSIGNGFRFGAMRGEFTVPTDFDAPLPEEVLASFKGGAST